jgi:hypothetical protein
VRLLKSPLKPVRFEVTTLLLDVFENVAVGAIRLFAIVRLLKFPLKLVKFDVTVTLLLDVFENDADGATK